MTANNYQEQIAYYDHDTFGKPDSLIERGEKTPPMFLSLDLDDSVLSRGASIDDAKKIALRLQAYKPLYVEQLFMVVNTQRGADQLLQNEKYTPFTEITWNINGQNIRMPFLLCEWSYIAMILPANQLRLLPDQVMGSALTTNLDNGEVLVKYIPKEIATFYHAQNTYKDAIEVLIGKENFNWEEGRTIGISLQPTEKGIGRYGKKKFTEEETTFYYQYRFGYDLKQDQLQDFIRKIPNKERHKKVGQKDRAKYRMIKLMLDGKSANNSNIDADIIGAYDKLRNNGFYQQSSIKLGADVDIMPEIVGREGKAFILTKFIEFYNHAYHPMLPQNPVQIGWNDFLLLEDNTDAGKAIVDKMKFLKQGGIVLPVQADSGLTDSTYYYKLGQLLLQYHLIAEASNDKIESILAAIELCTHRILIDKLTQEIAVRGEKNHLLALMARSEEQRRIKTIFCVGPDISANITLIKAGHTGTDVLNKVPIKYNTDLIEGLDQIKEIAFKNPNLMLNSSIIIKISDADEYHKLEEFFKSLKHAFSIFGISRPNLSILILKPYLVDKQSVVQTLPVTDDQRFLCGKRNGDYKFCMFQYNLTERDDVAQVNHRITSLLQEAI